jgi:hypothetical protein
VTNSLAYHTGINCCNESFLTRVEVTKVPYYAVVLTVAVKVSHCRQKDVNFIHVTDTFERMANFSPEMFKIISLFCQQQTTMNYILRAQTPKRT